MGTILGSKQLKAIAVSGKGVVPVADGDRLIKLSKRAVAIMMDSFLSNLFHELGTAGQVEYSQEIGAMSNQYFTKGVFEGAQKISGSVMAETLLVSKKSCFACPIGCGRIISIPSGQYSLSRTDGPEYETIAAFGSNLLVDNLEGIAYANYLCNAYGMDTISCGVTIGFAYFLHDKGVLREPEIMGLDPKWGDIDTAIQLIELITQRERLGDMLAEGVRYMGHHFGMEEYAAHVKGLEFPFQDLRAYFGMVPCYATSPRGACHMQGDMFLVDAGQEVPEVGIISSNRHTNRGKAEIAMRSQNLRSLYNALIMCQFLNIPVQLICDLHASVTGCDLNLKMVNSIGERIFNLKRVFNNRMGITRTDDTLPQFLLTPLREGGTAGKIPNVDYQLREYYQERKWDWRTGRPLDLKLNELELDPSFKSKGEAKNAI
jgi:aldehyde:ferredoxin oxidoreductase